MLLTKSDFKVGRTCPTKLYYRKRGYPTNNQDDPYVQFLADGGYMVEAIAQALFAEGKEVEGATVEERIENTRQLLEEENITLFQATLSHEQLIADVDILEKRGDRFRIIEVKAKSVEPNEDGSSPFRGKRKRISSEWKPYLEDLTFQTHILKSVYPSAEITPCLCVVDKSQTSNSETIFENFHIEPREKDRSSFRKPLIAFSGDIDALKKESFVKIFEVLSEVDELLPLVITEAAKLAASIASDNPTRIDPVLGTACKNCEYRDEVNDGGGFRECWGELADASPHLLDLYYISSLDNIITKMVEQRKAHLTDLSPDLFKGKLGERQALQLEYTIKDNEFIDSKLPKLLAECKYPLHFLDFEASRLAVPYHAGMHPYGQVAFQWSCHTIPESGAELEHREWIKVDDKYPNFEFGRSLKEVITREGTVFVWTSFERSALKDIERQLSARKEQDEGLNAWLKLMIKKEGPIVDLYELAKAYYFHPRMRGNLSIKDVLPAVWFSAERIRNHRWFSKYLKKQNGEAFEPYKTLPALPFGDESGEDADAVREGTAAIRTYQEMLYGRNRNNKEFRDTMKQRLLNYCELDTAAMVMIWMHWSKAIAR